MRATESTVNRVKDAKNIHRKLRPFYYDKALLIRIWMMCDECAYLLPQQVLLIHFTENPYCCSLHCCCVGGDANDVHTHSNMCRQHKTRQSVTWQQRRACSSCVWVCTQVLTGIYLVLPKSRVVNTPLAVCSFISGERTSNILQRALAFTYDTHCCTGNQYKN